jgi:hypothetical protein
MNPRAGMAALFFAAVFFYIGFFGRDVWNYHVNNVGNEPSTTVRPIRLLGHRNEHCNGDYPTSKRSSSGKQGTAKDSPAPVPTEL